MCFFCEKFNNSAVYSSIGLFITDEKWIHSARIIDSYELILGIEGVLPINVDGVDFSVEKWDILIIPPNTIHKGYKHTKNVKFLWLHFSLENLLFISDFIQTSEIIVDENLCLPSFTHLENGNRLYIMCSQLIDLYEENVPKVYLNSYLNSILNELSYQTKKNLKKSLVNEKRMQPIKEWIRVNAFKDISLDDVAIHFNYNKNYLSRKYKEEFGIGVVDQITKFRIEKAKFLLTEFDFNITQIANEVGYSDSKYFMRVFHRLENMTPTEYRYTFNKRHYNIN